MAGSPNLHNNTATVQLLNRREEYTVNIGLFVLEVLRIHQLTHHSQDKTTKHATICTNAEPIFVTYCAENVRTLLLITLNP